MCLLFIFPKRSGGELGGMRRLTASLYHDDTHTETEGGEEKLARWRYGTEMATRWYRSHRGRHYVKVIWLSLTLIEIHWQSLSCSLTECIYEPCNATEDRVKTATPFHSFKVTLGEALWAPTQITLDELPPSHFSYITAPPPYRKAARRQEIRGRPHTERRVAKWHWDSRGVTHIVSSMSWQSVPLSCTV